MKKYLFLLVIFLTTNLTYSQDKKNWLKIGIVAANQPKFLNTEPRQFGPQIGFGPGLIYGRLLTKRTFFAIGSQYFYYTRPKDFRVDDNGIIKTYSEKHSFLFYYTGCGSYLTDDKYVCAGFRLGMATKFLNRTSNFAEYNSKFNNSSFAWGLYMGYRWFGFSYLNVGKESFLLGAVFYIIDF